ncbi:acyltransferase family protein [Gemmiger sp.]
MTQSCSTASSQCAASSFVCYPAIDRCRIVMAFLVMAIHYHPFTGVNPAVDYFSAQYLARLAVPFFFCCNGYFLYHAAKSEGQLSSKIFGSFRKALRMYIFWTIVYFPIILYMVIKQIRKQHVSPVKPIFRTLRDIVLVGSYNHLWYLLGLSVALLILWIVRVRCRMRWTHIDLLACVLYFLGSMYDAYRYAIRGWSIWQIPVLKLLLKLYHVTFAQTRNGIFFGFPFLVLGILIARKNTYRPRRFYLTAFLITLAVGACETSLLWRIRAFSPKAGQNMCLFLLPATYFLFCLLVQTTSSADTTRTIRKFSSLLFLLHPWVIFAYNTFYGKILGNPKFLLSSPIGYCIIAVITCWCSVLALRISQRPNFAWAKQFY